MSKVTTTALARDLTLLAGDATQIGLFYDRVVEDLSRFPWLTTASIVAVSTTTGQIQLTDTMSKILAMFWDTRQLAPLTLDQVESFNRLWRGERGDPHSYVVEDEPHKVFRLYPRPIAPNKALSYPNSQPLGKDFPAYAVTILHTELRVDLPEWLELPVALECAAREMERESNHRDVRWATQARSMADTLFSMVGKS